MEGSRGKGLLFYVRDCTIDDASKWLTTFLSNLRITYQDESTRIYEGTYHGCVETISITKYENDAFLEIQIASSPTHLPWKTDVEFARDAFHYFKRELRTIPEQSHYPGEYWAIDGRGEHLIDWE